MIVLSFYAHREDRWGINYHDCLAVLQESCDRLKLRHMVISDKQQGPFETFVTDLPDNLMEACLVGQRNARRDLSGPLLFTGADCVLTRDPRSDFIETEMAFTVWPFGDCCLNTGLIFTGHKGATQLWDKALELNPREWGEDQLSLKAVLDPVPRQVGKPVDEIRLGMKTRWLSCKTHNWAPDHKDDPAGLPAIAHFRGTRKPWMRHWYDRFVRGG
jgi:hypothetical protein